MEGPTDDDHVKTVRERVRRSMLLTLFASLGTPMLLGGDEFGRTQGGNNNAYAQDNEISWFDWRLARSAEGRALTDYVAGLIALRRRYAILRNEQFLYGQAEVAPGILDVDWFDERGLRLSPEDWDNASGRALNMRRAHRCEDGHVEVVSLLLNASDTRLLFNLPAPVTHGRVLVDTSDSRIRERPTDGRILVANHSAVLLVADLAGPFDDAGASG